MKSLSARLGIFATLVLTAACPVALAPLVFHQAAIADPIRLHIDGLSQESARKVRIGFVDPQHTSIDMTGNRVVTTTWYFLPDMWAEKLFIVLPAEILPEIDGWKVRVDIGDERFDYSAKEVRGWSQITQPGGTLLTVPLPVRESALPWGPRTLVNWPGDGVFLHAVTQAALVPMVFVLFLGFWFLRGRSPAGRAWSYPVLGLATKEEGADFPLGSRRDLRTLNGGWNWGGCGVLILGLVALEIRQPFYFTQDDNLIECLPMILVGCRSIWQGEFPDYNPFVFLGAPLASLGMYSLTYPPLHLAYALARHLLHDEKATVEIFAILHLLAGFFVFRRLARKLGMGEMTGNLTALSYVLAGPWLIMGRSWFNFIPLVFWLPVLSLGLLRLRDGPASWKWIMGMGLAVGLSFHVGFTQAAIYLVGFLGLELGFLVLTGSILWRRALAVVPVLLLGAGIALPLVYQQWLLAQGIERQPDEGLGIAAGLPAMLLPYPLVQTQLPTRWGNDRPLEMGQFYFFGLFGMLFFFQVAGLFWYRPRRGRWTAQVWTICALFALWLGLGTAGGLWQIATWMPGLGQIHRFPFRLMPFIVFFASLTGGMMLERLLQLGTWKAEFVAGAAGLLLLAVHLHYCRGAFYLFQTPLYPPLPEPLHSALVKDEQPTGRILSWAALRSNDVNFTFLLPQNVPAVYGLPTGVGHNPILEGRPFFRKKWLDYPPWMIVSPDSPDARQFMRAYGVRWHLLPTRTAEVSSPRSRSWPFEVLTINDALLRRLDPEKLPGFRLDDDGLFVGELADAAPLAFPADDPNRSLPITLNGWGVKIDVSSLPSQSVVVANFLYYPDMRSGGAEMRADVDGQAVPCKPDEWRRIETRLPAAGKFLSIRYCPPWESGLWLGLGAVAAGVGGFLILRRVDRQ